jgi:dCTP deaminase
MLCAMSPRGALLVDRELRALLGTAITPAPGAQPIDPRQVQPASVDLRLGAHVREIRASFLPGRTSVAERLAELATRRLALDGAGAVLERGRVYLGELAEELALPGELAATFNPRSSAGRCDLFTRVLVAGHPRYNEAPPGYRGPLWIEIAPLSFDVRLVRGDRLCQMRLARGAPALSPDELREEYARTPLCFDERAPVPLATARFDGEGGLLLHLGLAGREPAGWRARESGGTVVFGGGAHEVASFWEPVHAPDGRCILAPGRFHIFASRERVRVPPHLAAEMEPVDLGLGEMRNNYAGFFDSGFGWRSDGAPQGTPAVLEVRAHDVPFLVEEAQVFFRLRFFRNSGAPERLYGDTPDSYQDQDLSLARMFSPPGGMR